MLSPELESVASMLEEKGIRLAQSIDKHKQFSRFFENYTRDDNIQRIGELVANDLLYYKNKINPFIKQVMEEYNVAYTNNFTNNVYVDLEIVSDPNVLELLVESIDSENLGEQIQYPERYTPISFQIGALEEIDDPHSFFLLNEGVTNADKINSYLKIELEKYTAREVRNLISRINNIPFTQSEFLQLLPIKNTSTSLDADSVLYRILVFCMVKKGIAESYSYNSGRETLVEMYSTIFNIIKNSSKQAIDYYYSLKNNGIMYLTSIAEKDEFGKNNLKVLLIERPYLEYVERTKNQVNSVDALLGLHKNCNPQIPRLDVDTIVAQMDELAKGYLNLVHSQNVINNSNRVMASKSILLDAFKNGLGLLPPEVMADLNLERDVSFLIANIESELASYYQDLLEGDVYKVVVLITDKLIFKNSGLVEFAKELDRAASYCQNPDSVNPGLINKIAIINILIKKLILQSLDI